MEACDKTMEAWHGIAEGHSGIVVPISEVLSRFTTSSIVVPDMAALLASARRSSGFHPRK